MAVSADGFIARKDGSVDWTSKDTWKSYFDFCKKTGNLIIGKKSYDIMPVEEFRDNCFYVVVSHKSDAKKKTSNIVFTDKSPKEIVEFLKNKGFDEVGIGGGAIINSLFMSENLIDEIYLDVEPVILGEGIRLFSEDNFDKRLILESSKKFLSGMVHNHYIVKK